MRTFLRGKITLLFMTFGLLLAIPAIALADNVVNNVIVTPSTGGQMQVTVEAGKTSAAVAYRINATGGDTTDTTGPTGQNCNPVVKPAQLTISGLPAGVSVKDSTGTTTLTAPHLTFTTWGVDQSVTFAVANNTTPGNYAITVADITNNGYTSGDFAETNGTFNLVVTADVTSPDTVIDTGPSGTVTSDSATFTFHSTEANSTFETRLDNGTWVNNGTATSKTYNSLSDALHTFDVRAKDPSGNVDASPATQTWTVNTVPPNTAPQVSVTGVDDGASYNKGSVPTAMCDVTDAEDGNSSFAATLSAITGPYASDGIGSQEATCSYTDSGGLGPATASVTYNIVDPSAPVITKVVTPASPDGDNGWYTSDVTVDWTVSDPESPNSIQKTGCVDQSITSDQAATTYSCSATSAGGNAPEQSVTIKRDATEPSVTVSLSRATADHNGWYNHAVDYSVSAKSDATSGIDSCQPLATYSGPDDQNASVSRTCLDVAGNTGSDSESFQYDATPPEVTDAGRKTQPNVDGWYGSAAFNKFTASDATSALADSTKANCEVGTGTQEGSGLTAASGTVSDNAGNTAASLTSTATFNVDLSDPYDVLFVGGPNASGSYDFGNVPAAPTCTAKDDVSGLKSCAVTDSNTGGTGAVGSHTLTATATDKAGHTATATRSYTVAAASVKGFYQPIDMNGTVNTVKGGSTVPAKFELFGGATNTEQKNLSDVSSMSAKQVACGTLTGQTDAIEEIVSTNATGLRFDTTGDQFIYNWKTPKSPGTCYSLTMTAADNTTKLVAYFKLT